MGGCASGLAATQRRAGAARLFYGTTNYVLCTADLGGLYTSTDGSWQRTGPRGTGTTNALRHRDYGSVATRGIIYPAHIRTEPLSRGLRHSTRRAPQPFRGSGPEQRISELVDSEADGCWRTMRSDGT